MWSLIQVLPNKVNQISFYMFEDESPMQSVKLHKKPSETLRAD